MNGGDPPQVDGFLLRVRLDDFEFRVLHNELFAAPPGPPIDHQPLALGDHFFHEVDVVPAADDLPAQGVGVHLGKRHIEHETPPLETARGGFEDVATDADRLVAFLAREAVELPPILITPGEVGEQVFKRVQPKALE